MKAVFRFPSAILLAAALGLTPMSATAQETDDPSVINPDEGAPGTMPELPLPPESGDEGPMVRPAPDADPEIPPEAFGGPLDDDEDGTAEMPPEEGEEAPSTDLAEPGEQQPETLDTLFAELKKIGDENEAKRTARKIQRRWHDSGSDTIDLLMRRATRAMGQKESETVLDLLDQVLVLEPDYAEAWNRRATAHFASGQYGKSISDIEQTLVREPRHWGALMGLALILERTKQDEKALEVYREVLDVYPALKSAQDAVGRLSEKLTGPSI
ncbi:tetratricopeptide repeat protein [Fulvimarina sp. MAC8]|uniref:tetratricopeptide repeat protein n=1 Tax=Fulvimarina sp. MAC8 TaxID=3162874 RepID=UPI0032EEDC15